MADITEFSEVVSRLTVAIERIAPALERIAAALEQGGRLDQVERSAAPVTTTRLETAESIQARLDESREANDPDAVLAARDELASHLDEPALAALDRDVLVWLLAIIQRRMRAGTVGLDVAQWADQVVSRYAETREGANLKAALPILRRCAGLCPRCGLPYAGLENICSRCARGEQQGGPAALPEGVAAEVPSEATITAEEPEVDPDDWSGDGLYVDDDPEIDWTT